ncbi:hypothetical protein Oter_1185 [Opitutus terrae PB90-1]|uniref:DUF1998 domain-containing protein n=2 Tax=Opitutus terrae TaxID=107709 RepID=B1ZPF2_OPITP|nr:hypothetical protein Oter_1185 [Opitutus terrae PB90-1]
MNFNRGKVQILYGYLPGAVFAHDEYGHCRVTMIELSALGQINRAALAEVVGDMLNQWPNDWQRQAFPAVRNADDLARNYFVGEPTGVKFEPFPTALRCPRCGRVYRLRDLQRSTATPGQCPLVGCGGKLEQMPFVQAHQCGRLDEMFVQREGCSIHGTTSLYFDDTGRVTTARWRCRQCAGAEVARLRQTPCNCSYSLLGTEDPSEKRLRFLPVTDPAVFKPQIAPFINFPHDDMARLSGPEARPWVLARIWGLLATPVRDAMAAGSTSDEDPMVAAAFRDLAALAPDNPRVREYTARRTARHAGAAVADRMLRLVPGATPQTLRVSRRLLEQVAVLDNVATLTIDAAAQRAANRGDEPHERRLRDIQIWARERLGLAELRALDGFPIGLAAVGFTRIKADPNQTILNPFPQYNRRTPLYAVVAETEAIYFQLDPQRVVRWLQQNQLLPTAPLATNEEAWARLYGEVPGLGLRRNDPLFQQPAASAVRTLVHSISHVLLRHIEWSGYAAQSIGEYLIPEGIACVLYASRYTDTRVGGLLTLFEQGIDRWLRSALDEGGDCVLDPFCSEEGGACVGCLHREFNCTEFNRELSRAVLFGGTVAQHGPALVPFGPNVSGYWRM